MMDSLPYRNDAAMVLRRLIRSLPTRARRARHRHLRQGIAGHDDGAGGHARSALRARSRRRHAAAGERRRRRQDSDDRRPLCPRPTHPRGSGRAGLPGLCLAGRRLPVSGHGGHLAGRRRSTRAWRLPHSALAPSRPTDLARHGPALGAALVATCRAADDNARISSPTPRCAMP